MPTPNRYLSLFFLALAAVNCHAFEDSLGLPGIQGTLGDLPSVFQSKTGLTIFDGNSQVSMVVKDYVLTDKRGQMLASCPRISSGPCPLYDSLVKLPGTDPDGAGLPFFSQKHVGKETWYEVRVAGRTGWIPGRAGLKVRYIETSLNGALASPNDLFTKPNVEIFASPGEKPIQLSQWRSRMRNGFELLIKIDGFVLSRGAEYVKVSFWQARPEILAGELSPRQPVRLPGAPVGYIRLRDRTGSLNLWYASREE